MSREEVNRRDCYGTVGTCKISEHSKSGDCKKFLVLARILSFL